VSYAVNISKIRTNRILSMSMAIRLFVRTAGMSLTLAIDTISKKLL